MKVHATRNVPKRRLGKALEMLEARLPLAGDVLAVLTPQGDLNLEGDSEGNRIGIVLEGDQIVASSLDGTTRINGQLDFRFPAASLLGILRVDLAEGNDTLRLGGKAHDHEMTVLDAEGGHDDHDEGESRLSIPGGITIATGAGSDSVRISFVETAGDLKIHTSEDDWAADDVDLVNIGRGPGFGEEGHHASAVLASESTTMAEPGCGDEGGPPADVLVKGDTRVITGGAADSVRIAFAHLQGSLTLNTGPGADLVVTGRGPIRGRHGGGGGGDHGGDHHEMTAVEGESPDDHGHGGRPVDVRVKQDVRVHLGSDDNYMMLRNLGVHGQLTVRSTDGDDAVGLQNVKVVAAAVISTGAGQDTLAVWQSRFDSHLEVDSGPGSDYALLDTIEVTGGLNVSMAASNDTLVLVDSHVLGVTQLDGGPGRNHLAIRDTFFENYAGGLRWQLDDLSIIDSVLDSALTLFGPFLQGR